MIEIFDKVKKFYQRVGPKFDPRIARGFRLCYEAFREYYEETDHYNQSLLISELREEINELKKQSRQSEKKELKSYIDKITKLRRQKKFLIELANKHGYHHIYYTNPISITDSGDSTLSEASQSIK